MGTAMFMASKYEEIYAPECRDFVYISDKAYTRDEILRMEGLMLAKLNFQLTAPNAFVFVKRFAKVAGIATTPRSTTELLDKATTNSLQAVRKKYTQEKHGNVSSIAPAHL